MQVSATAPPLGALSGELQLTFNSSLYKLEQNKTGMSTSDSVCGILIIACFDVMTGICLDFVSLREYPSPAYLSVLLVGQR